MRALRCACNLAATVLTLPLAIAAGFGRLLLFFCAAAHLVAMLPGWPGERFRAAFYSMTLARCSQANVIGFGSFFAHPSARVGDGVRIGPYSLLGRCSIGNHTQLEAYVTVLGGRHQHKRNSLGQIGGAQEENFVMIHIEDDCLIGAHAIIMASIGHGTVVRPGSVVLNDLPPDSIVAGNPAHSCNDLQLEMT